MSEINIIKSIYELNRILQIKIQERVKKYNLTYSESRVLYHLQQNPGINQEALAAIVGVSKNVMTQRLNRLFEKELIIREGSEKDRRSKTIKLTEQGNAIIEEVESFLIKYNDELLDNIRPFDQKNLQISLQRMIFNAKKFI